MKDKIKAMLEKEAPLIEWLVEDWPHSENTLWVIGQITLNGGEKITGDCVLGDDNVLDDNGEIIDKTLYAVFGLTSDDPGYEEYIGKPEWLESAILTIGYQLDLKLTGRYSYEYGDKELAKLAKIARQA